MRFWNRLAALIAPAVIIFGLSGVCNASGSLPSWIRRFHALLSGDVVYGKPFYDGQYYFVEVSVNEKWREYGFERGILRYVRLTKEETHPYYHDIFDVFPIYQFQSLAFLTMYGSYLTLLGYFMTNDMHPDKVVTVPGVEKRYFWNDEEGVVFMIERYDGEQCAYGFISDTKRIDIYSASPLLPILLPPEFVNRPSNEDATKDELDLAYLLYWTSALGADYEID